MSPKIHKPLDIYVRVSDTRGRSGDSFISPKDQEQRCRALAKARGYMIGDVFTDLDVSGGTMDRPQFNKALERIRDGISGGIIVARMDRFSRSLRGAIETLENIEEAGGYLIECDGDWDTSTPMGRFGRDLVIRLGQLYREQIGDAWLTAKRSAVDRGIHISSRVPPGYVRGDNRRLIPHPEHANAVREAFTMAALGEPYARIADHLTKAHVANGNGSKVWLPNRIKRLLKNRVYLGEARYGEITNPNAHEPLVDARTWTLAQRTPTGPSLTSTNTLLAGLVRCASCSFAMRTQGASQGTRSYRCPTSTTHGRCPSPSTVAAKRIDDYVIAELLAHAPLVLEQTEAPDETDALAQAAVDAEQSYRDALTDLDLRAKIGAADHAQMVSALYDAWQEALANVPEQTRRVPTLAKATLAEVVAELQRRGDMDSLRELLGSAIQAVFVRPAASRARNLPLTDRVKIVWRENDPLELPRRGERFEPRAYTW